MLNWSSWTLLICRSRRELELKYMKIQHFIMQVNNWHGRIIDDYLMMINDNLLHFSTIGSEYVSSSLQKSKKVTFVEKKNCEKCDLLHANDMID